MSCCECLDNLTMKRMVFIPLFLQLLPLLDSQTVLKYYTLFINLFTNINASLNLKQLLSLPVWCDYIFSFICVVRKQFQDIVESVWGQLQTLLISIVASSVEKSPSGPIKTVAASTEQLAFNSSNRYVRGISE